jgi:hypothetical protein
VCRCSNLPAKTRLRPPESLCRSRDKLGDRANGQEAVAADVSAEAANGHMAATTEVRQDHRALDVDGGVATARFMPFGSSALDAGAEIGGIWLVRLAPGTCWKRSET